MIRTLFALIPAAAMVVLAQAPQKTAPPEVEQALRARVSEFFQDYVDGHFRQAEALVAEQSKDYYYASNKPKLKGFHIDGITWGKDFSKARVTVVVEREWEMRPMQKGMSDVPLATAWMLEGGKWCWYNETAPDAWVTPMGPSDVEALKKAQAAPQVPKDLSPDAIAAMGKQILQGGGTLDKSEVFLSTEKPSSDQVVFTNRSEGYVKLDVEGAQGLSAVFDKTEVGAGEKAILKISYTPSDTKPPETVRIRVEPMQKIFVVRVKTGS